MEDGKVRDREDWILDLVYLYNEARLNEARLFFCYNNFTAIRSLVGIPIAYFFRKEKALHEIIKKIIIHQKWKNEGSMQLDTGFTGYI